MTSLYLILGAVVLIGGTFGVMKLMLKKRDSEIQYLKGVLSTKQILLDSKDVTIAQLKKNRDKAILQYKKNIANLNATISGLQKTITLSAKYLEDAQKIDATTKKEIAKITKLRMSVPDLDSKELTDAEKNILDSAAARLAAFYNKL